jgi:O-antigen/teichoic acid export membrane protein
MEYGELDIIIIFSSVLFVLVDLQFTAGFSRLYYERRAAGKDKRFVGTAIIARLIGGTTVPLGFLLLGFFGNLEFSFLPSFRGNTAAWVLAVISVPLTLTYDILLLQTRMLRWKKWFALGSLANCVLSCLLSAFFAVVWQWGMVSVVLGLLIGKVVGLALLGWGLRKEVDLRLDFEPFKELIRYTWPLIPGFWLSFGSVYVNRFFVFAELGADENAILSLCMKITGVIGMFAIAFQSAWQPLAMSHIGSAAGDAFYVRSTRLFVAGSILSMFFITALLDPILSILAPSAYSVVKYYFPMFAVGMVLGTCATNMQLGHQIARTTHWISIAAFISIAINVTILALFTKSHGIFAAGSAWVVSFTASYLIMYFTAQRNHYIPYDTRAFFFLGLACGLLLMMGSMSYRQLIPNWFFTSCAAVIGVVLSWFVIKDSERDAIELFFGFVRRRGLST